MSKYFNYTRAQAYVRSGNRSDLVDESGVLSRIVGKRGWLLVIVPVFCLSLALTVVAGRMFAGDPQQLDMLLPEHEESAVPGQDAAVAGSLTALSGHADPSTESGTSVPQSLPVEPPAPEVHTRDIVVKSGDTLMDLLVREGVPQDEAHGVIGALQQVFNPRRLQHEHALTITYESSEDVPLEFKSLNIKLDPVREVMVDRCADEGFRANEIMHECESRTMCAEFQIASSLYESASEHGVPFDMLLPVISAYAYDVDFQRDIRGGDNFEIMYDMKVDAHGTPVCPGTVTYAALTTQGRRLTLYHYCDSNGDEDYFDEQGRSLKKNLMVTPVEGARISSGYGRRRHPILGYSRMHKGLDFAAPTGTPIMAAGDGVVEWACRKGGYGNAVQLRHANSYTTLYAHMRRFGRGVRSGVRVKQGQVIGYVGSTGMSTGPHLHYEVHHHGRHINPASIKSKPNRVLHDSELARFMQAKTALEVRFAALKKPAVFAGLEQPEA